MDLDTGLLFRAKQEALLNDFMNSEQSKQRIDCALVSGQKTRKIIIIAVGTLRTILALFVAWPIWRTVSE